MQHKTHISLSERELPLYPRTELSVHTQEKTMKTITKFMVAALAVAAAGAAAVHTIEAHVISTSSALQRNVAPGSKTYADWQGPLGQSFGARFLAQGAPQDAIAGTTPGHGLSLPIFQGLEHMQVWHAAPGPEGS
jgi:hypothetical protein